MLLMNKGSRRHHGIGWVSVASMAATIACYPPRAH
jgi:hypothetical protein